MIEPVIREKLLTGLDKSAFIEGPGWPSGPSDKMAISLLGPKSEKCYLGVNQAK